VGKVIVGGATTRPPAASAGRVLVTGGTGYLGSLVAAWLTTQQVGSVSLLARNAHASRALAQLLAGGSMMPMSVTQCDAGLSADMAALLNSGEPIQAVFHAGGVLADATLQQVTLSGVRRVSAAKQAALGRLMALQQAQPAAQLVLFSSVASLLGSAGQASYAAANAALDAAAAALQAGGVAALSVQWGAWAGAGMAANDPQTAARVERMGMGLIEPRRGLAALEGALATVATSGAACAPVVTAVPFNWRRMAQRLGSRVPTLFSEVIVVAGVGSSAAGAAPRRGAAPAARRRPRESAAAAAAEVGRQVEEAVRSIVGREVGARPEGCWLCGAQCCRSST
jgi:NADP-dependent 3-hydroxy acid dehydrogenase YdfG